MKGGLDVPLHGSVRNNNLDTIDPQFSAVIAEDYFGLKPKILVKEGEEISIGQAIWEDKTNPGFTVKSPASGTIHEINRGDKRALVSVVVKRHGDQTRTFERSSNYLENLSNAGLWDSFKERPFNRVPDIGTSPDFLFINACKSDDLEVSPNQILEIERESFIRIYTKK